MVFEDLVEKKIGYIFSEDGVYEPDEITFTVLEDERVEIGDIVCIKHPRLDTVVFYQVVEVPVKRKARDYEEDLARIGQPLFDETRNYPRARAKQIGYVDDVEKLLKGESTIDDLVMLIEHIKPLNEVYRPRPQVIDMLLKPRSPSIGIGRIYPNWKHELYFDLKRLLRQGLLVVGGIGTGKTTTMLTILIRITRKFLELGGKPHVLIIDKDGEYGSQKLIDLVGIDNYVRIPIDNISEAEYVDREEYAETLLAELGYTGRKSKAAKLLYEFIEKELHDNILILSPEYVEEKIIKKIISDPRFYEVRGEIRQRFNMWKKRFSPASARIYSISQILSILREKIIIHIDLSATRDYNRAYRILYNLLKLLYEEILRDPDFGCILVIDEAHFYAPERSGIHLASSKYTEPLRDILHVIATTGPRNGLTLFIATQRPSLISKTITTQMGQNIIAHRVEDVDLERIAEIMGGIARKVRVLPRGWALVKALAAKIREPLIVRIDAETFPGSTGRTAYDKFLSCSKT